MYPPRFFPTKFFPGRFFPPTGGIPPEEPEATILDIFEIKSGQILVRVDRGKSINVTIGGVIDV